MKKQSKEAWLEAGMALLEKEGFAAVTIDNLCTALLLTKGSFYHRFKNTDGYVEALMEYWLEKHTHAFIREADRAKSPTERQEKLYDMAIRASHGSEKAIRGWSFSHPVVRQYVERVDAIRLDYLTRIQTELEVSPKAARYHAITVYALLIGLQQLFPEMEPQQHFDMMATIRLTHSRP